MNGTIAGGAPGALDFERVAGAEIMDRAHPAERRPVAQHRVEADQIGVVIFLRLGRRQRRARQIEPQPAQRLGAVAVVDPGEARDQHALGRAEQPQLAIAARPLSSASGAIGGDVLGARGKALDPHRAADPVRAGDDADADLLSPPLSMRSEPGDRGDRGSASARGRPRRAAASAAAFWRSCAFALGADLIGVSRIAGFSISPASPKKRATRSVGNAPTPSQCWTRSDFKVTRSAWPRSSIGL